MENSFYEINRDLANTSLISENRNNAFPKHFHKNIELHYILGGRVRATVNEQSFIMEKNTMLLVPPFFSHGFESIEESDTIVLLPANDLINNFHDFFQTSQTQIFLPDVEYNKTVLLLLKALLKCPKNISRNTLSNFINIILDLIIAHYPAQEKEYNQLFNLSINLQTYIDQHYTEELSLDKLADALGYSKYYISKTLKRYTNKNFYEYINMVRINYAVSLYSSSNCSFEELGRKCGFKNTSTFFRAFRSLHGTTPKAFFEKQSTFFEHAKTNYTNFPIKR